VPMPSQKRSGRVAYWFHRQCRYPWDAGNGWCDWVYW
jgi:hypothetical protein